MTDSILTEGPGRTAVMRFDTKSRTNIPTAFAHLPAASGALVELKDMCTTVFMVRDAGFRTLILNLSMGHEHEKLNRYPSWFFSI